MIDVRDIYKDVNEYLNKEVVLNGWIRNHRKQKEFGFITFFDGTVFESVQIVYDKNNQADIWRKVQCESLIITG